MSWDFDLKDPVTKKVLELPSEHLMTGGTYRASYDENTGEFSPMPIKEATLNITYNYSKYYYEALKETQYSKDGIRCLDEMPAADSILVLTTMIQNIEKNYKVDDEFISTQKERWFKDEYGLPYEQFTPRYLQIQSEPYKKKVMVYEGNTDNYWEDTAANALRPLYQLLTMAKLRPDGVWEVS